MRAPSSSTRTPHSAQLGTLWTLGDELLGEWANAPPARNASARSWRSEHSHSVKSDDRRERDGSRTSVGGANKCACTLVSRRILGFRRLRFFTPLSRYRTNGNAHVIEFKNLSVYIAYYCAHLFLDKVIGRLPMSWYPDPIHTHKTNPNLEHIGDVSITR